MLAHGPGRRKRLVLVTCGGLLAGGALALVAHPAGGDIPRHVALTLGAWAVWMVALFVGFRLSDRWRRFDLAFIFLIAVLIRGPLLFTTPSLSDDAYRAVWDARLVHAGVNPYEYAPAAVQTEPYRDDVIWPRVNHKEQRTPYPTFATLLSGAAYAVAPEQLVAMQGLAAAADLLAAALLAWLLARIGSDPRRSLAVAWSPLGALHFAHSGHNDAIMVAALVAAPLLLSFGRRYTPFVALGLATATKGLPALVVPAFARAGGWVGVAFWAITCAILTLPFLGAGHGLLAGAVTEAGGQRFNDSIFLLVERVVERVARGQGAAVAFVVMVVVVIVATVVSARRSDGTAGSGLVAGSWVLGAYILVAPVVEPWYFTWLTPLV